VHLAEFNIARLRHPLDDPRSAGFKDNLDRVNGAAKRMPGFLWVLEDEAGVATFFRIDDDPQMLVNLSIWESAGHLKRFVFGPVHGHFYARRAEWFDAVERVILVFWHVAPGERPSLEEAMRRLAHLETHGPSPFAFGWAEAIGADETANSHST